MAKHNQVILFGWVGTAPRYAKDANGNPVRAMFGLEIMHGNRDFGNNIDDVKYDVPIVMSSDAEMIKKISEIQPNDILLVKGTVTTRDITKRTKCKFCGHQHEKEGNLVCITPIFIDIYASGISRDKGYMMMRDRCEISNMVTVIAPLCREPAYYRTEKGTSVTTYQLAIRRKFKIKKDADIRTDFPWVKSYGQIADNDAKSLKKGSYVFIDGRIQTRTIKRRQVCSECGQEYEWTDSATEIVPYAVEYLRDYFTIDEIRAKEAELGRKVAEEVLNEESIEERKPFGTPDYQDDDNDDEKPDGNIADDVLK